jgi:hypothetical protein
MIKKIVFGAALALVIVGLMAPSASANCAVSKSVSTYNTASGAYTYWHSTLTAPGATLVAKLWQPVTPFTDVTGSCNTDPGILYFTPHFATDGAIGMSINLSNACVTGAACANGSLAVMATINGSKPATPNKKETEFLVSQANETPGGGLTFDFSAKGGDAGTLPRPRITNSTPGHSGGPAQVTLDAASGPLYDGSAGAVTGFNILSAAGNADPGRLATAYSAPLNVASTGGGPTTTSYNVVCQAGLTRSFIVTQLVTNGGGSPTVSEATQVSCDSSLAEPPGGKYKIVPKPKAAPNSKKAN